MPVFQKTQLVNAGLETCWNFFSNPANLSRITPPEMDFRILFPDPVPVMYAGMIIRYKVRPFPFMKVTWITEITQVKEKHFFIDTQVSGPYRLWHHQHLFRATPDGVEMTDIVNYELPFGFIGKLLAGRMVKRKVEAIFKHRTKVISRLFPERMSG
ncbi:MAG TPA: SRPBCC family protein [Lentimicrobium sp.]|nr:SRPBCC family protein [Lentimicrobium sp.]